MLQVAPVSQQIWDMKYRLKSHDGEVLDKTIDDTWRRVEHDLRAHLDQVLTGSEVPWQLHYLAGRPDRALTHLARAVDAAVLIVGTHAPGAGRKVHELLEGSVAAHLARHQHRPVLTVPLSVVDWKATPSAWDR